MYTGLQGLLDEFGAGITKSKYNSYMPILKNSFIPFLNDKYSKEIEKSMDRFFGIMISTRDIIDGGINYVDNTKKVVGEAAIDKYLTATNMFFKDVIYPKWPNCQLSTVENFKVFYGDIRENCGKELKGYSPRAHLEDDDYEGLLEYLDELNSDSARGAMAKAVIPLILLYGFKIGTIAEIKTDCFSPELRKLKLNNQDIWLELPYKIYLNVNRIYQKNINAPYLFDVGKNQRLISDYFDDIINAYNARLSKKAKITLDDERPIDRLADEKLLPLKREYIIDRINLRRVEKDCLISYAGNKYSVPAEYVGKDVTVIVLDHMLAAYFEGKQIALHKLSYSKNSLNVNKEHYKSMIVKSGFDIENTLLNNPDLVDLSIPNHSLKKYDELMGGVIL